MEKELKSSMGFLLGAALTGYGHPSHFCQNGSDDCALLGQPSKGLPCRISIMFYYTKIKNQRSICPVIFLDFRTVCAWTILLGLQLTAQCFFIIFGILNVCTVKQQVVARLAQQHFSVSSTLSQYRVSHIEMYFLNWL